MKITRYDYHGGIVIEKGRREYWRIVNNKVRIWDRSGKIEELSGNEIHKIGISKSNEKKIILLTQSGLREIECQNKQDRDLWLSTIETIRRLCIQSTEKYISKDLKTKTENTLQEKQNEIPLINVNEEKIEGYSTKLLIDKENDEMTDVLTLIEDEEKKKQIEEETDKDEKKIKEIVFQRKQQREEEMRKWKELQQHSKNKDITQPSNENKSITEVVKNEVVDDVLKKAIDLASEIIGENEDIEKLKIEEEDKQETNSQINTETKDKQIQDILKNKFEEKDKYHSSEELTIKEEIEEILHTQSISNKEIKTDDNHQQKTKIQKEISNSIEENENEPKILFEKEEIQKENTENQEQESSDISLEFSDEDVDEEVFTEKNKEQPVEMNLMDFLGTESITEEIDETSESENHDEFKGLDFDEMMKQLDIPTDSNVQEIKEEQKIEEDNDKTDEEIEFEIEEDNSEIEINKE
ncbi:Ring-infected erythrocyte surface antigen, putative [Entamoeba dispar SAW760]|uniref:Ring-infected erythrocyte surface antigen, putative n=1 Tax=Entamoeba dispar (strain ATCC PRA-260 / SAW760) TaxID=370354 RepID=B0E6Z8_ENTDS|nr:Ring-infected erythrocyte surface antigen, putative [Entamoeba dispar SAW760]EDR29739.1 Ring-infected erythrocyte surface antigen, putative [Entamoeba dispar SAW760]|eukprot:EDR29739.1 Ring-infected erythrocyte surface antigen, putative [Entamoeba dispar SAW760]